MTPTEIKLSKTRAEGEIRAVVRKLSHRPTHEIVTYLRQARNLAANPDFIDTIKREGFTL